MSQADYQAVSERAQDNVRVEFVPESTTGVTPTDPAFVTMADFFLSSPGFSPEANVTAENVQGNSDAERHSRGSVANSLAFSYWLAQAPVDGSGDPNDPFGTLLTYDPGTNLDSHTVVWRREQSTGGADGAGFRDYVVGRGAYPTSATPSGDASSPYTVIDLTYGDVALAENVVIHQPSSGTTLEVVSDDANDTTQTVTIESEDGNTTEDVSLNGTTAATTTPTFTDIDVVNLDAETAGDVTVSDGSGTTFCTLVGTNTDIVDGQLGVPAVGSGSHGSAIGGDPAEYILQATTTTFGSGLNTPTRIQSHDFTVEVDTSGGGMEGTRQMAINPGQRTVSTTMGVEGPYESQQELEDYLYGRNDTITWTFTDFTLALNNAQATSVDDKGYSAGDAELEYSVTFEGSSGSGSEAVTATNTS